MDEPRTTELSMRYLDDDLSPAEHTELRDLLAASADARAVFIALTMTGELVHESFNDASAPREPAVPKPRAAAQRGPGVSARRFRTTPIAWSLAAAVLLTAAAIAIYAFAFSTPPTEIHDPESDAPVATLIEATTDGALTTPGDLAVEGREYGSGEYALASGTAEFMLTNAVNVKLRGNSRLVMHNNMRVTLTRGSASFVCPKDASGFAVALPDGSRIVDLGTAFTVNIEDSDRAEVRVTDGRVRIDRAGDDGGAVSTFVEAGQVAIAGPHGVEVDIAPVRFIYRESFDGDPEQPLDARELDSPDGTAVWSASAWRADGTISASGKNNSWLAFTPVAGNVYTLSIDANPTAGGSDWFALGFASGNHTSNDFYANGPVGWMLNRANRGLSNSLVTWKGPGTSVNANHTSVAGVVELKVVLDTQPTLWTVEWFRNGTSIRGPEAFTTNPTINYVGFTRYGSAAGTVQRFELSVESHADPAFIPDPSNAENTR